MGSLADFLAHNDAALSSIVEWFLKEEQHQGVNNARGWLMSIHDALENAIESSPLIKVTDKDSAKMLAAAGLLTLFKWSAREQLTNRAGMKEYEPWK